MNVYIRLCVLGWLGLSAGLAMAGRPDCDDPKSYAETIICASPQLLKADSELRGLILAGQELAEDIHAEYYIELGQDIWEMYVRDTCENEACLIQLYRRRIADLRTLFNIRVPEDVPLTPNGSPAFTLIKGLHKPVCKAYLDVLNRTPAEELKACKLPDLSGTEFVPLPFTPLTGDALKAMDKFIYEQDGGPRLDWAEKWPQRQKEYAMGYRELAVGYWDLDQDGQPDQIVRDKSPSYSCITLEDDFEKYW